jgi:serine protease DegQ
VKISRLPILAAVALGIAGGFGFSTLAVTESTSKAPALSAPVPMTATTDVIRRPQADELRGDAFSRIPAIVERVQPVVVSVLVRTSEGGAEGSGVVFDGRRGLVVTNNHVVADATGVDVVLADGQRLDARVYATDALSDLALLAVERGGLPQARFADDLPRVGELAIALGNPLGFENSVTAGIVSGLHRAIPSAGQAPSLVDLIQTDAPISPGNSGGALVDRQGKVIGINVAAIPPTQQTRAVSIGFAIPAQTAVSVVRQLLQTGEPSTRSSESSRPA